jgi:hypothetical protein
VQGGAVDRFGVETLFGRVAGQRREFYAGAWSDRRPGRQAGIGQRVDPGVRIASRLRESGLGESGVGVRLAVAVPAEVAAPLARVAVPGLRHPVPVVVAAGVVPSRFVAAGFVAGVVRVRVPLGVAGIPAAIRLVLVVARSVHDFAR